MRTLPAAAAVALILANQAALADDGWMTPPGCRMMPTATLFYCDGASPTGEGPPVPEPPAESRKPRWYHARHYWHPQSWNPHEESY